MRESNWASLPQVPGILGSWALVEFGDFSRLCRPLCGESLTHRARPNPNNSLAAAPPWVLRTVMFEALVFLFQGPAGSK